MGRVHVDEIIGYQLQGEIVCHGCATQQEYNEAVEDEIITKGDQDSQDILIFCDRCKERL